MSVFLKIFKCIFCSEEEQHDDRYDKTSYRSPLLESRSNDTSVTRSSAPSYNDLLCQVDPSLTRKEPNALSLQPKDVVDTTLNNSAIVSQDLKSSSHLETTFSYKPPTSSFDSESPHLSSTLLLSSSTTYTSSAKPPTSSSKQSLSSPESATSSILSPSFSELPSSSASPFLSSTKAPPSCSNPSPSFPNPTSSSPKPSPSPAQPTSLETPLSFYKAPPSSILSPPSPKPSTSSSQLSPSFSKPPTSSFKPSPSSPKAPSSSSSSESSQSSYGIYPSSTKPRSSPKSTLSPLPSSMTNQQTKTKYVWARKDTSPVYKIPKVIEDLFKEDIVLLPKVLKKPLSPSTYKDYFAALIYAEDFYIEKWSNFKLENVTLELQKRTNYKKSAKNRYFNKSDAKDDKIFVAFEIENVPEKLPVLLFRDFVLARPSGSKVKPFQGILYRVEKSTRVLVEFGDDFHSQHYSTCKYDVSFSLNRVYLKRAHQAIAAASDSVFRNFIFPNKLARKNIPTSPHLSCYRKLALDQKSAVFRILSFQGSPPYLVQGPLCVKQTVSYSRELSRTGLVVREAVLQICRSSPESRILICAPLNKTCDVLMKSLKQDIRESDMFQANAAFREIDGVPIDILPCCPYQGKRFVCPPLRELQKFRVILSTFISSFHLRKEGITAGHFTHIFLVDTSSATEPEAMVVLSNLADEKTAVVATGAPKNHSGWVRSDIARRYGLKISYFERLCDSNPYRSLDPLFITRLDDF